MGEKCVSIYKKNNLDHDVDAVHHFNHISFREPGFLYKLDKPFFWGPVSGTVEIPSSFIKELKIKNKILAYVRNVLIIFQKNIQKKSD